MKVVYSDRHAGHDPQQFIVRGRMVRSNERPERAERLLAAALGLGLAQVAPDDFGPGPRAAIHTPRYLHFLETAWARWQALPDASDEVLPNVHPFPDQPASYPDSLVGQAGWHQGDMACSISRHTWEASVWAAHCATHAARLVLDGERAAYALCRPPGHHAYADRANGFTYLNNAAIAAQVLRERHARVAVIDIDVHHGNGTQGIFWRRRDVLTVSLHGDPHFCTPFFTGHAHEIGEGDGQGFNLNLPLARHTGDTDYLRALGTAMTAVRAYAPGAVVVALGLDAHERDPYQALGVTTAGFGPILAEMARLGLPTVLVQEGGYLSDDLGPNLASALSGFLAAA